MYLWGFNLLQTAKAWAYEVGSIWGAFLEAGLGVLCADAWENRRRELWSFTKAAAPVTVMPRVNTFTFFHPCALPPFITLFFWPSRLRWCSFKVLWSHLINEHRERMSRKFIQCHSSEQKCDLLFSWVFLKLSKLDFVIIYLFCNQRFC